MILNAWLLKQVTGCACGENVHSAAESRSSGSVRATAQWEQWLYKPECLDSC